MKRLSIAAICVSLISIATAGYMYVKTPIKTETLVREVKSGTVLILNQLDVSSGGTGTGFLIDDNTIVTNHHVIDGNGKLMVVFPGNPTKYDAQLVYSDVISDIAVVKIKDWEKFKIENNPTNLTLADSNEAVVGSKVVVIGHPWGLTWTVSEGIVSYKGRRPGPNPKYIDQVDAKLFQGNSGGPIFNENGEVVCVSELMLSGEGGSYGFCLPSNLVKKVLYDLKAFNEVRWRVINASVSNEDHVVGVMLGELEPNGAGAKAGLKEKDRIIGINGKPVLFTDELITELATLNGDVETVTLLVVRDGQEVSVDVKTNYKLSKEYSVK